MKSIKKVLAVLLAMIMAFGVVSASVFAEEELPEAEVTAIDYVNVTVEAPMAGYLADGLAFAEAPSYEVVDLEWTDAETDEVLYSTNEDAEIVEKAFEEYAIYTVKVALGAADGYAFDAESETLKVEVNGKKAEIVEITEDGNVMIISCDFVCQAEDADIDDGGMGTNFDGIFAFLKTILQTFLRLIGTLLGF